MRQLGRKALINTTHMRPSHAPVSTPSLLLLLLSYNVQGWNRRLMDTTHKLRTTSEKLMEEKKKLDALIVRQYEVCGAGRNMLR